MSSECLMVFTRDNADTLLKYKGTQEWSLNLKRARKCHYVICVANALDERSDFKEEPYDHAKGFLIGKNLRIEKSIYGDDSKFIIEFEEFAKIAIPNLWGASRNPVKYADLDHLGIDITNLKFETAPERDWEWVREDMFHKNYLDGKTPDAGSVGVDQNEIGELSIDQAKIGLSKKFGVSVDDIEIIIKA